MARRVQEFPAVSAKRYPDEWFNGEVWRLDPETDSGAKDTEAFRRYLMTAARERGIRVRVEAVDGVVYLQQIGPRGPRRVRNSGSTRTVGYA